MKTITKCSECGGTNIETKAWVNPDTGIFISDMGDRDPMDNWCQNCAAHVAFITVDESEEVKDSGDILSDSWLAKADKESEARKEK